MEEDRDKSQLTVEEFLNKLLTQAVKERASDIHLEPGADNLRVRFRIDGILQERLALPLNDHEYILNRLKVLANLDTLARTTPQDGYVEVEISLPAADDKKKKEVGTSSLADKLSSVLFAKNNGGDIQIKNRHPDKLNEEEKHNVYARLSLFPTINGEAAVLRMLNRKDMLLPLEELGMDKNSLRIIKKMIAKVYGMTLITGPAGSGKTTNLYAILREIKSGEKNIMTLEDPIEFRLEDIRQSQIAAERGFTFAVGMRSILRQDPDAIMIGEIRDPETAEQAVRAALIGRAIYSTVHANTTVGTIARLVDMNIERSLIAYALNGVISKRLVRKICPDCRVTYTPDPEHLKYLGLEEVNYEFTRGKGCDTCADTGYFGRTGLFEVLELDDKLRSLIVERASMEILQQYVESIGMKTLKQDAVEKIMAGITTIEEVVKVV